MGVRYRLVLRSTETHPSEETQESVLPALSQQFGQRAAVQAADVDPGDRGGDTVVGHVEVDSPDVLLAVYEYVKPHSLVRVGNVLVSDGGLVRARKEHEVDRDRVADRDGASVLGTVDGTVLVRVPPEETDDLR